MNWKHIYIFFPWTTGAAAGQHSFLSLYSDICPHSRYKSSLAPWACVFVVVEKLCACQNISPPSSYLEFKLLHSSYTYYIVCYWGARYQGPGPTPISLSILSLCCVWTNFLTPAPWVRAPSIPTGTTETRGVSCPAEVMSSRTSMDLKKTVPILCGFAV